MCLLIYSETKSVRLSYIFHHIFDHILGLDIEITHDSDFFKKSLYPKLNYSKKAFSNELFFHASDLLFEDDIKHQDLYFSTYQGVKVFFLCSQGVLPFDPFAASFYMLTRYEEYISNKEDHIGRFLVEDSIAFKQEFITTPVVDYWILFIKEQLLNFFPSIRFKKQKFQFINTIDVDNAYAYLEKGFFRTLGGSVIDILRLDFYNFYNRIKSIMYQQKDPYDTYEELLRIHNKYKLKTIFFFLLADYGTYDKNISPYNDKYRKQIKDISIYCDIGIHASFKSIKFHDSLLLEIRRLENILNNNIVKNRQHFLCLNMPYNYRNLIQNGIKYDYSMGFPTHPGFRAGTSYNFYFFDLASNANTDLLVYPFSVMDVSLKNYLNLTPEESLDLVKDIIQKIQYVDGTFISIWHNESLYYGDAWKNWDFVYENMIKFIVDEKN